MAFFYGNLQLLNKSELKSFIDLYQRCLEDPVVFAEEVLTANLWWQQKDILRSVFDNRYTAVKSCHGSGKTYTASIALLAWIRLHPPGEALVVTTSASWAQVEGELWGEVHKFMSKSKWPWPKANKTDLHMPDGSWAFGLSTDNPGNFHGFHAPHVLVIVDEAAEVKAEIFSALKGIRAAGNVHMLYLMNPTVSAGPPVELFEDDNVNKFTVDGLNTPNMEGYHIYENVDMNNEDNDLDWAHNILALSSEPINDCELDDEPRPELIRRRAIVEQYRESIKIYGGIKPEDLDWQARIRGQFPSEMQTQLIKRDWIQRAQNNYINKSDSVTVVGMDVAGPGKDETAICIRNGFKITGQFSWVKEDPYDDIKRIVGPPNPNLWFHVDAVAIGWGICTALVRDGYQVKPCNVKERPDDATRFANKKSEWYWHLRELFQGDEDGLPLIGVPLGESIDSRCCEQLLTIRWDMQGPHGTVRIEPKEAAEKRGVRSPDRAESMMLCFAGSPYRISTRSLVYNSAPIIQGNTELSGPGWNSRLAISNGFAMSSEEMPSVETSAVERTPRAIDNWLSTLEQQKQAKKAAVRSLLKEQSTSVFDANGKFIGNRVYPLDPGEKRRLEALLEPGD